MDLAIVDEAVKKLIFVGILILLVGAGYWALSKPEVIKVTLTSVEKGVVEATVANTRAGTIMACQRSKLSLPIGGQVAELNVDDGDRVKAGQVLLTLWNQDKQAQLAQARAHLAESRQKEKELCFAAARDQREASRQQTLAKNGLTSEERLDTANTKAQISGLACDGARSTIAEAEAMVRLQQSLYDQTILRAPFDGVVAEINGEIGEYVTPSPPGVATPPAVDLIDDRCLYVRAPIDEVDAAAIQVGMPARVTLDAFRERHFSGKVERIAPYVKDYEKQARTVDIDVKLDQKPTNITLLVGYSADIEIILDKKTAVLRVPTETILEGNRVLRFNGDNRQLEAVMLMPGISNWVYTEVQQGLVAGDRILLSLDTEGAEAGAVVEPEQSTVVHGDEE